ncbi:MAG: hypothetical protein KJP02_06850 [Octadecabacter sp.]|nr:hypothetical protein [Octadecabacter sp.]
MNVDPNILIVIATLVTVFSASSVIAAWAERVFPPVAVVSLVIGIGLFVFLYMTIPGGLGPMDIPNAFIAVVAMIL